MALLKTDWHQIWDAQPRAFEAQDYLRQVGKTVRGVPMVPRQFTLMIAEIGERLELTGHDAVLDLCCGNGVITNELSHGCRHILGVDFSQPLIDIARRDHMPANAEYIHASILDFERFADHKWQPFGKVLLYDALQHFERNQLTQILAGLLPVTTPDARILFGGVPYRPHRKHWLDSPRKRILHMYYKLVGRDMLGTWWDEHDFLRAATALGLHCSFHLQAAEMYNSHFRFDVVVCKSTPGVGG